jgi:opacity protein-like surface antigen
MGGFARLYSNSPGSNFNGSTTDTEIEADAGVAKRITRHWDVTVDYSYARYSALDRMYSPQTFSIGTIFHFQKR